MGFLADSLSPGTRLGEILFGLIMTLTFTLGAGAYFGGSEGATTELLYATIGCNIAWGIIDAALMLFNTIFDRSRLARLGTAIASSPNDDAAVAIVASELDETLVPITTTDQRDALYRNVVTQVRSSERQASATDAGGLPRRDRHLLVRVCGEFSGRAAVPADRRSVACAARFQRIADRHSVLGRLPMGRLHEPVAAGYRFGARCHLSHARGDCDSSRRMTPALASGSCRIITKQQPTSLHLTKGKIMSPQTVETLAAQRMLDVLIRAGLIAVLAIFCYGVFRPFLNLMLWSLILAITLYPAHLVAQIESRQRRPRRDAARTDRHRADARARSTSSARRWRSRRSTRSSVVKSGEYHIPPPPESVAGWPLIGERLHAIWLSASTDLTALVRKWAPELKDAGMTALGTLAGVGIGFLVFIAALIIAGVFMAFGETGSNSAVRILHAPDRTGAWTARSPNCAPPPFARWRRAWSASRSFRRCCSASAFWSKAFPARDCWRWQRCCSASCSCLSC